MMFEWQLIKLYNTSFVCSLHAMIIRHTVVGAENQRPNPERKPRLFLFLIYISPFDIYQIYLRSITNNGELEAFHLIQVNHIQVQKLISNSLW